MTCFHVAVLLFALLSFCDGQTAKPGLNEPGFTCIPGKVFKADCNTCSCDTSGTLARCTAMACPPEERTKRAIEEAPCTPGTVKMLACNRCRCTATQIWACTRKACPDAVVEVEDMNNYDNHQQLKRSIPRELINRFFVPPNPRNNVEIVKAEIVADFIVESPSEMIDDNESQPIDSEFLNQPCKPNAPFKIECNTCWCKTDGSGPKYCTRIACKPKSYKPLNRQQ